MIAVPITTAESAPGDVDRARQIGGERAIARVEREADQRRAPARPGSPQQQRRRRACARSGSVERRASGTVRLSSSVVGSDSTSAQNERERGTARPRIQRRAPRRRAAAAASSARGPRRRSGAEDDEGDEARPALARVPGQPRAARPPGRRATAMPSPNARMPQTAAAIHEAVAEHEDERQHRERVERGCRADSRAPCSASRHMPAAAEPRQQQPVEERTRPSAMSRGLRPASGSAAGTRSATPRRGRACARELAARQAHARRPGARRPRAASRTRLAQAFGERPRLVAELALRLRAVVGPVLAEHARPRRA